MASKSKQQQRIEELLATYDETIRAAFQASIQDFVDSARLGAIITALERGDIEGAVQATHVEAAAFQPLDTALRQAFSPARLKSYHYRDSYVDHRTATMPVRV